MKATPKILAAGGALAAVLVGGLALYGTGSNLGNLAASGPCAEAAPVAARLAPLARGDVAAFDASAPPKPAPAVAFKGPDGAPTDLASLRGKLLLVNLWATWCAPCKAEMPALDRLQAELGGDSFQVVAINVETRNLDKPPAWFKANGIAHLTYYGDPEGKVLPVIQSAVGSTGLPTTMLIDAKGCTLGVMKGPAEWSSEDGKRLIRAALAKSS
ncbi:thiol:disulfide interchange protein [Methylorubrum extorquens]|uniref:Redoxin domain protein n=2 Tax=Methylorubrum extorquens TaxID=408 RepID=C5AYD9_METEA|nr:MULTISPECIES: TlpA disulfide reductase family protein [Methylorubrum]ACS41238.1 Redoxin domain protein [Methylorubrum extorquens AM1]APX86272.1 thiol:disulfide interchange protein [Methylorubrum extorquens]MCP1540602.1 thiol-disulfide isomerase/thioredoxin [Methylorubrum extorquens]MCP1586861.1 thiol-disulfide isomerase/thioredoxin [Methylorubrum extorquens]BDL40662.1 thiol:disulfide interchange protein TlpA [Methylorubrum sp. GM97]